MSALELHRLAQLYSRDVGDLLEDRFEESNPVEAMFRAHPELRECPAATASLRLCGDVHREVANLCELLELDRAVQPVPKYSLRAPKSKWDAVQQGSAAAEKERRRLDLGILASQLPVEHWHDVVGDPFPRWAGHGVLGLRRRPSTAGGEGPPSFSS